MNPLQRGADTMSKKIPMSRTKQLNTMDFGPEGSGATTTNRPQRRRRVLAGCLTATLSLSVTLAGSGVAQAGEHRYVACPVNQRGVGCWISGKVVRGSTIAHYKYQRWDGTYGDEVRSETCSMPACSFISMAVADKSRIPAGFDVYAQGIVGGFEVQPIYPRG
jgi:hypothetical protein